jgi:hypothetical protein
MIPLSIQAFEADGNILLFGGGRDIYEYYGMSPTPVWELTPGQGWRVLTELPLPPGAAVSQTSQGEILVGGGAVVQISGDGTMANSVLSSAYLFSPEDLSIRSLPDLNVPRYYAVAACAQDRAYFFGGMGNGGYARTVEWLRLPAGTEELPSASWESQVYDLGAGYELTQLGWSAANGPSLTLSYSEDGVNWQELAPMTTGGEIASRPLARYVRIKVDFPAGAPSSVGDIALTYDIPAAPKPDLSVASIEFDPPSPEVGQDATVYALVRNEGASSTTTSVRLYADGEQVGGEYLLPYMILPVGMEESIAFTYTCASPGPVTFTAMVDPDGLIVESNEGNNNLSATLEVRPSGIQASVSTDKASYLPEEDVSVSSTVRNDSDRDRCPYLEFIIEDASGNYVDYLGYEYLDSLTPGEERTFNSSWNTRFIYSGDYRVRASVVEDGFEKAAATAPFAIDPQGNLALSATCDRISYLTGDQAGLNARLISEALNFCFSGLTVRAEVLSPDGSVVYSSNMPGPDLYPADLADVPFAFEVAGSTAGTYTFRATVFDGDEDIASAEATFVVASTTASGAGISGSLSAAPQVLEQGAPFTIDYTLANQGNDGLSGLPVWLLVVDPQTGNAVDSRELSIDLTQGASAQGTEAFSSAALASIEGGKNYLAILVTQVGDGTKTLGFTTLKVTPPALDHFEVSPVEDQVAGVPFQVEIRAISAYGLDVPYAGTLSFANTTGTLSPSQSEMAGGTFTGSFTITKATGDDVITLSGAGLNATSNTFEVVPGQADHLTVEPVASPQVAGTPFTLNASAYDVYNNPASSFNGACTLTDATGTVDPQAASFVSGVITTQVTVTKATASDAVTIAAGTLNATTNAFEVLAGPADHLTVEAITSPQVAGTPFTLSATAYDAYDNPAVSFVEACTISDTTGTVDPQAASFVSGVLNVQITVTKATTSDAMTLSASGLTITTNSFEVMAGVADHLTVESVATPQVVGTPFTLNASAYDAYNNPASGFNEACTLTDATGTLAPSTAAFTAGVFTTQVTVTKATAADAVTLSAGGLIVTTNSFEVAAGPADHLTVEAISSPQVAGTPFTLNASAYDAYNNPATSFNGACTLTDTTGTSTLTTATFLSGVLTTQVTVTKAITSKELVVMVGGITVTSNSFEVASGPADHLTVEPVVSPQQTGTSFVLTAAAYDAYNNPATAFNSVCTLTDSTGTLTPATSAFSGGQMSAQATINQAISSDVITISAGGIEAVSNPFEVKSSGPAADIDLTICVENQTAVPSVLVWTDSDANEAMAEEVLTASGCYFTIVRADHDGSWHGDGDHNRYGCGDGNGNDNDNGNGHHEGGADSFAAEMRSGLYNTYLLLSPDHPLEGHLADELRELVNAGAGLLLSDPKDANHFKEHPAKGGVIDLFGVKEKGSLSSGAYTANLTGSALSPTTTLAFTGKMKKLEIDDAQVLGTVSIRKGNKTEAWPALTLKQYGMGKASLVAFDFAQVAQVDREKAKTILNRALTALPAAGSQLSAGSPLPLNVTLTNHGSAAQVKVEIPLPAGASYLWAGGGTLEQGKVVFTLPLTQGEQRQLHLLLVPQQTGTLIFTASLFYQEQGSYVLLKNASTSVTITADATALQAEALAVIDALSVANKDRHNKEHAYEKVEGIDITEQDPHEIDEGIEELTKAVDDLQKISSTDITTARLLVDRLLIQLQMRWYELSGGGN